MTVALPRFEATTFEYAGRTRAVYRAGSGPAVIVMHEMPGLHPLVIDFGRRLVDEGYTVLMVDQPGHPTRDARDRMLAFLKDRLI
jgi:hypothetical protein